MDILFPEFKRLLLTLLKHKVKFMLIGGYAVIYYGYERSTNDMDLWIETSELNKQSLLEALKEYGVGEDSLYQIQSVDFKSAQVFYLGKPPRRIDFLTKIQQVKFNDAYLNVNRFPLENHQVPIINYEHLILSKISNDRLKDKADVEELQKINKYRNNF